MATYNFKFHDAGNNEIRSEEPSLPIFHIATTRGFMDMPQTTVVSCTAGGNNKPETVRGEIDWKKKTIVVEGTIKPLKETKHKIGGTFSLSLEWSWLSGKYTTEGKSGVWTAKRGGEVVAIYTSLKVNAFSKNELATLKFLVNMPTEEKVFLTLALMFHDFQLPPVAEPKTFGQAAAGAGGQVAATVATNALTSCCCMQ